MKSSYTPLMQSKYFSVAFNSAVFDGPYRIYFAQFHESIALKIYFLIQQRAGVNFADLRQHSHKLRLNFYVMLYPTQESFEYSFDDVGPEELWHSEVWNRDLVVGIRRPLEDSEMSTFIDDLALRVVHHIEAMDEEQTDMAMDL